MLSTGLLTKFSVLWLATVATLKVSSSSILNSSASANATNTRNGTSKPNFVFIITDDQDLHLSSMDYMPFVQKHFGQGGTFYKRHYCTISICCPSRVSLLTGKAAHNTNVTDVSPPFGGYPKFISQGFNDKYLPVWLQEAGYNTYYTGKLMNGHSTSTYNDPFVSGWNGSDFLIDPGTYLYWNATFQRNHSPPSSFPDDYSTDLVNEKGLDFLNVAANGSKPFFLGIAPIAPHAVTKSGNFSPPDPAPRHQDLFPDLKAPRTDNFNPEEPSGASWVFNLERLNDTVIEHHDDFYRRRIQSLQAVDELVDNVINRLTEQNLLDNTYIIYTSDNGFHIGQHRLQPGKTCAFEEDINVPFYIRGPGIEKGKTVDLVTTHTDIVPTLFELAGIELRDDFDGKPMPVTEKAIEAAEQVRSVKKNEHVNVEFWGVGIQEGTFGGRGQNNTYKTLRIFGDGYNLMYTVWCTNEHELYDMSKDPGQLNNLARSSSNQTQLLNQPIDKVQGRLDALLLVLKTCKASSCRDPWAVLHPNSTVTNLEAALSSTYDAFYEAQPKVSYSKCELGQILDSEGPLVGNVYEGSDMWPNWV
ncbi:Arylsulphatase [Massarina eburnea CBS 473.64]|uniref:Arylsulfatase n=1 Tax=Massarina eburnea CBS 473.64 TaxID=1395130 RepID=A0A6A6RKY7_9PLEO|nr:Arylsulphatase [Massarina eburnea CBS 473.64]